MATKDAVEFFGSTDIDELLRNKISLSDAANRLGKSVQQIRRYQAAGQLAAFKIGRQYYTTQEAIRAFLAASNNAGRTRRKVERRNGAALCV